MVQVCEFLSHAYPGLDLMEGVDGRFPVAAFQLTAQSRSDIDKFFSGRRVRSRVQNSGFVDRLFRQHADWWSSETYVFSGARLNASGQVRGAACRLGSYLDMLDTADYLELELLASSAAQAEAVTLSALPYRKQLLKGFATARECVLSGGGVSATIGISVLVVFPHRGSYHALVERRPKRIGPNGSMYHVIPAMLHQPIQTLSGALEYATPRDSIFREYLEELFGLAEPHIAPSDSPKQVVASHPNHLFLTSLLQGGRARLEGVAMAFNLLNHRPDLCMLLLIDDEAWFDAQSGSAKRKTKSGLWRLSAVKARQFQRQVDEQSLTGALPIRSPLWAAMVTPENASPPGAAAIALGMRRACELLGIREPRWLASLACRFS
jgi:hypothetical protein